MAFTTASSTAVHGCEQRDAELEEPQSPPNSLFDSDEDSEVGLYSPAASSSAAGLDCPPVPGLYLIRNAIPVELQMLLTQNLSASAWPAGSNQAMFFSSVDQSALPSYLDGLVQMLHQILEPLPREVQSIILDSQQPRQAILNLYPPGAGISPHIDLPHRYLDGIVGCSLGGSAVMDFTRKGASHSVLLRPGDVYILSGEARWEWMHGIAARMEDLVQEKACSEPFVLRRRTRMSVTFRRMQSGADCVGGEDEAKSMP